LAKDPASLPRVGAVLHNLLEALRVAAQLLSPFLPEACTKIFAFLELPAEQLQAYELPWGKAFPLGHHVQKPQPLFPRIA
jgi:methionyl-tRNA synthetase